MLCPAQIAPMSKLLVRPLLVYERHQVCPWQLPPLPTPSGMRYETLALWYGRSVLVYERATTVGQSAPQHSKQREPRYHTPHQHVTKMPFALMNC